MTVYPFLTKENAYIFRLLHRRNLPWVLDNGFHCRSSTVRDPDFVSIGRPDLIEERTTRDVRATLGGTLSDYVPFYFTPSSPMLYNIVTGTGGVQQRDPRDLVIVTVSLHDLAAAHVRFVFTQVHAALQYATFYESVKDLRVLDWDLLQRRDFQRDPEDPGKFDRYQAEALVHRVLSPSLIRGVACYDDATRDAVKAEVDRRGSSIKVRAVKGWFLI